MRGADEEGTPPELAPAVCRGSRKKWAGLGRLTLYSIFIPEHGATTTRWLLRPRTSLLPAWSVSDSLTDPGGWLGSCKDMLSVGRLPIRD